MLYFKPYLSFSVEDHRKWLFDKSTYVCFWSSFAQNRRLLIIATSSLRPILTDLGLAETFDSEMHVPPVSSLRALEFVVRELELFSSSEERREAIRMLEEAGFASDKNDMTSKLQIGIKKLLSIIEMARQEPESVAVRLIGALMGLGM